MWSVVTPSALIHKLIINFDTLMVLPDRATIVPSGVGETFFVVSTSPHPEQSKRSITFTDPSGVFYIYFFQTKEKRFHKN